MTNVTLRKFLPWICSGQPDDVADILSTLPTCMCDTCTMSRHINRHQSACLPDTSSHNAGRFCLLLTSAICIVQLTSSVIPHLTQAPSLPFNSHFPVGPGSAGSRMSPVSILLKQRMMKVVVTTGAIRCAKLQSNHHHQQTNTQFFTGKIPFLLLNQQCQSTEGKNQHYWYLIKLFIKLFKTSGLPMFLSFRLGRQISDE